MFQNKIDSILKDFNKKLKKLNNVIDQIDMRVEDINKQKENLEHEKNKHQATRQRAANVAKRIESLTE